jgi:hypothetical protein
VSGRSFASPASNPASRPRDRGVALDEHFANGADRTKNVFVHSDSERCCLVERAHMWNARKLRRRFLARALFLKLFPQILVGERENSCHTYGSEAG